MPTIEAAEQAERDLARIRAGWRPTAEDLAEAPIIQGWKTREMAFQPETLQLLGRVTGHPRFKDGSPIFTSAVVHLDENGGWARCVNRFYRLGRGEGETEH
jgi:hypothetical protein